MKSKSILFSSIALSIGAISFYLLFNEADQESYRPRIAMANLAIGHARSAAGAFEYYKSIKGNINTGNIELSDLLTSQAAIKQLDNQKKINGEDNINWQSLGPDNQGGRTYAVLFEKSNPTTLFAGAVSGGLWKSTTGGTSWIEVNQDFDNLNISCIHQASNGDMYFGTGEDIVNADGSGNSAFIGQGIWKSTDKGLTWTHLEATLPSVLNNAAIEFAFVSEIASVPSDPNIIYAATNLGVRKSIDGGTTWINPLVVIGGVPTAITGRAYNVDIASDGTIVCDISNKVFISTDGGETFENHSTKLGADNPNKLPATGIGRMSIDIAPSDPNYIYVQCASPIGGAGFEGVFRTTNKGGDWSVYVPGRVAGLNIFTQDPNVAVATTHQGWYDNVIKVHPTNKDKIYCGGIDLWSFSPATTFERISNWRGESTENFVNHYFVHADQHGIAFHPTNPDIMLFGSDGGVFRTDNGGITFKEINKGYATTQFYDMCFSSTGEIMGGLQDNGTQYINFEGNSLRAAKEVKGGDGFDVEISSLNPNAFFATSQNGDLGRSPGKGNSFSQFYDSSTTAAMTNSPFHTKIAMWEGKNSENFHDTIYFTATSPIAEGSIVNMVSKTASVPFKWTATRDYAVGETVDVADPIHNRLVVGNIGEVWLTDQALNFSTTPLWFKVATSGFTSTPGQGANDALSPNFPVVSFAFSTSGEYLYLGQADGGVFRLSFLNTIRNNGISKNDKHTGTLGSPFCRLTLKRIGKFGRTVTSLAVDPQNANNLVVTLGNYGATDAYVYKCSNATSAPSSNTTLNFTSIQGDLPKMPVYASVIDYQNPEVIVLGTEYGIYSSSEGGFTWNSRRTGMGKVSVFALRQQTLPYNECWNSGVLYAGTHGKGMYKSDALVGLKDMAKKPSSALELITYPNPVTESATINFSVEKVREIDVTIYDINGKAIKSFDLNKKQVGAHQFEFSAEELTSGTYIVSINGGHDYKKLSKFVVLK